MSSRAERFMWDTGDCTVDMPRLSVTEEVDANDGDIAGHTFHGNKMRLSITTEAEQ